VHTTNKESKKEQHVKTEFTFSCCDLWDSWGEVCEEKRSEEGKRTNWICIAFGEGRGEKKLPSTLLFLLIYNIRLLNYSILLGKPSLHLRVNILKQNTLFFLVLYHVLCNHCLLSPPLSVLLLNLFFFLRTTTTWWLIQPRD
jgi:hypothetical protein